MRDFAIREDMMKPFHPKAAPGRRIRARFRPAWVEGSGAGTDCYDAWPATGLV